MRTRWKLLGLAGVAGVAATGAVVAQRQLRDQQEYTPEELRDKLHSRLAETGPNGDGPAAQSGDAASASA
jgi:hypothetical protein